MRESLAPVMAVLAVNVGSSSLKFSLHPLDPERPGQVLPAWLKGAAQGLEPQGQASVSWRWQTPPPQAGEGGALSAVQGEERLSPSEDPFGVALAWLRDALLAQPGLPALSAVAHRVVHGGARFSQSLVVDEAVLNELAELNSLAPLHQPHNLRGIRAMAQAWPHLPQVACFDTAFHATLPEVEYRYAIPEAQAQQGIRRYGFHGLSYQYLSGALRSHSARAHGRVLMAHLGNGASVCAALQGQSCATSMGFSALDGLMMGSRCGSLDAGVVLHWMAQGWTHRALQDLLYQHSGLLGVSGLTADMRRLRADGGARAQLAIDMFTHRVVRECGAMAACLQGMDVLAFSGGIGEHDAVLREQVCQRLAWLGVQIDTQANRAATGQAIVPIHSAHSAVEVWVVPTDEGHVAATEAAQLQFNANPIKTP